MKRKIYFSGSISGGRMDAELYGRIIRMMQKTEVVLTEHIGNINYSTDNRTIKDEQAIYEQDTAWLRECDLVIAECTQPSLGVGYEMAYAEKLGKPTYIFCRKGVHLSAMLCGDPYFSVYRYDNEEELFKLIWQLLSAEQSLQI